MKDNKKIGLISCIKGYWFPTIMSPLCVAVEVIMEILIPLIMADIINIINPSEGGKIYLLAFLKSSMNKPIYGAVIAAFILMAFATISLIFGVLSGVFSAKASCGYARNIRHNMYYNIQNFSFANIDKYQTSSLITRCTTDVTNVQNSFQMIIRIAVRAPFMMIFACVMSFKLNKDLALILVSFIPILAICLFLIMRFAHPNFKKMFRKYDDLNMVVQENIGGQRTVKAFVREKEETKKFTKESDEIKRYASKAEKLLALNNPLMQVAVNVCMSLALFFGSLFITEGTFDAGALSSFTAYVMQILMNLMMLSMVLVMITMSRASADRIREILNEKSTITNVENPIYEVKDGSIEFSHVDFAYNGDDEKAVLKDINISIKSGQTIGIIGGTGSAKSSLVNLIPRLYDITEGSLRVGGVEVKDYDIKTLRDAVSVVLQKNVLFSGTINSNLRWGNMNAKEEELVHAAKLAQADEFVSSFKDKYDSRIEQGGSNVSGGQRQRLCIARALVKKPKILILDDSTSAVDTKTDALIRKAFREEIPDTTKIIIAQRISSIEDCDQIIVLDDGHISGIGKHNELLKNNEIYREVYTSQVKGAGASE